MDRKKPAVFVVKRGSFLMDNPFWFGLGRCINADVCHWIGWIDGGSTFSLHVGTRRVRLVSNKLDYIGQTLYNSLLFCFFCKKEQDRSLLQCL